MAQPLKGKLAVVTGGSRGIGAAIATSLAAKGASLLLGYTSSSSLAAVEQLCKSLGEAHGVTCRFAQADLSAPAAAAKKIIEAAKLYFSDAEERLTIHILINNAGIGGNFNLGSIPEDAFHAQYAVNVLGPLMMTQETVPYLPTDRTGRVVNISSVSSQTGFVGQTIYGGTKAALEAMTRTWARELAERATVNAVNPGPVEGDMYRAAGEGFWRQMDSWHANMPLSAVREDLDDPALVEFAREKLGGRRPGYAREVADIVALLCFPEASFCTGSIVCANGGFRFTA